VNNIYDWIPIINEIPSQIRAGSSSRLVGTNTCSDLLTEFNVQILYTAYGISTNPQLGIVGLRFSYVSGSFSWRCEENNDCIDPNVFTGAASDNNNIGLKPKPYNLRSSVTFKRVSSGGPSPYTPPPPRIYAVLPDDIWYPFNIPSV
jgi:hypothetical protein